MSGAAPEQNFFRDVIYTAPARPPWDIQQHQPALETVSSVFSGRVLDVGCGLGDNALWVSSLAGVTAVAAVDIAELAVAEARRRQAAAAPHGAVVEFSVGDVLKPTHAPESFDTLLDSAVFHCIGDDTTQRAYLAAVTPLVKRGGRAVLLVFSTENPADGWRGPRRIEPEHARALWSEAGWRIDSLVTDARYKDTMGRCEGLGGHALLMTATRA